MMQMAYGILLLWVMVISELLVMWVKRKENIPWKEIIMNLNSGHIVLWIGRGFEVIAYAFIFDHFSTGLALALPVWLQWTLMFILWDLCFYWFHRIHHVIPFLWSVHVVHHEGEHFNLSLGIRNSWYSSLTSLPFFIPLAILGFPADQFMVLGSVHYFIQFYNHNHFNIKMGWLNYLFVTPSHHKVHHGRNKEYINKNCSGTFIIWDRLFGTFQEERDDIEIKLGASHPVRSVNPFWVNNVPVMRWFRIKEPVFIRSTPQFQFSEIYNGVAGLILFAWLVFYISVEKTWPASHLIVFFTLLLAGTIANGGMIDGKYSGLILWMLSVPLGLILMLWFLSVSSPVMILLSIITVMHALYAFHLLYKTDPNALITDPSKN